MLLQQAPFHSRLSFGRWLNDHGLTGIGVEVGTHRADYATVLLDSWNGTRLICVDPWLNPVGYESQAKYLWGDGNRDHDLEEARSRLARYGDRVIIRRCLSLEAARETEDNSLDFVYIDGDHSYDAVLADLTVWYPKLREGGILAGHDFVCPGELREDDWGTQIQPAVADFADKAGLTVYLVTENYPSPWSYYFVVPGARL